MYVLCLCNVSRKMKEDFGDSRPVVGAANVICAFPWVTNPSVYSLRSKDGVPLFCQQLCLLRLRESSSELTTLKILGAVGGFCKPHVTLTLLSFTVFIPFHSFSPSN